MEKRELRKRNLKGDKNSYRQQFLKETRSQFDYTNSWSCSALRTLIGVYGDFVAPANILIRRSSEQVSSSVISPLFNASSKAFVSLRFASKYEI